MRAADLWWPRVPAPQANAKQSAAGHRVVGNSAACAEVLGRWWLPACSNMSPSPRFSCCNCGPAGDLGGKLFPTSYTTAGARILLLLRASLCSRRAAAPPRSTPTDYRLPAGQLEGAAPLAAARWGQQCARHWCCCWRCYGLYSCITALVFVSAPHCAAPHVLRRRASSSPVSPRTGCAHT